MSGRSKYGGIYPMLSTRDMQRLNTYFNHDAVLDMWDVESVYELSPQAILAETSIWSHAEMAPCLGDPFYEREVERMKARDVALKERGDFEEKLRYDRERAAFYSAVTEKILRWANRFNVPLKRAPKTHEHYTVGKDYEKLDRRDELCSQYKQDNPEEYLTIDELFDVLNPYHAEVEQEMEQKYPGVVFRNI